MKPTASTCLVDDPRWQAICCRDPHQDRKFVYSVSTTGIFCYPSCGARRPKPKHVAFHPTKQAAIAAGFRPCKRCRPDLAPPQERAYTCISQVCRWIDSADVPPTLAVLAARAGMSPSHLHRLFKRITGLTPKAYAMAHRANRVRRKLQAGPTITEAIYEAGYGSSSRFYAHAKRELGMTPRQYRSGGGDDVIRFAVGQCSLGAVLVAATTRGVCAVFLGDQPDALVQDLERQFANATLLGADPAFEHHVGLVIGLIDNPGHAHNLPLDIRGTAFQRRVWHALSTIPIGQTRSYSQLAREIGQPKSARAVARACAANRLAVVIACHRVVRQDGSLSGYRWGVDRKAALLRIEATVPR
ncbi:MAG: bifunctional DNA-binding transcriptional regulator/O6-methylguanine-DNA methyltransferase Ada [Nannocystaceae bacterium]